MTPVGTYCRCGCGNTRAPAQGWWCSTRAARNCPGCDSSCHPVPCLGTWARDRECGTTTLAHGMARVATCCSGPGASTCQDGRGACVDAAGPSAGTQSLIQCGPRCHGIPPHCRSCRQLPKARGLSGGVTHGTGCVWAAALTILTLLDATALVPDVRVYSVTPWAPLVPVRVSAVILL